MAARATRRAPRPRVKKIEFINRTQGYLGAIKIDRKGDEKSVPVAPGERIFQTPEEVELTEQSHAHAEDSPYVVREIVHYEQATGDETNRFTAAPLERVVPEAAAA